ncbi:holo-ACP synthase [Candidatus Bathyarchaeota archaeon]|nr:MAG: holo-ACP synthase [Candidatus Bathyarchaeota archaeon]
MWEIGVDIVEVQRFNELDYPNHRNFYERTFTPQEIDYCLSFKQPAQHFAATFAGKEAVYKALSRHVNVKLREIEIVRNGGVPEVRLLTNENVNLEEIVRRPEIKVSLSHTSSYAVAFALAVFKEL